MMCRCIFRFLVLFAIISGLPAYGQQSKLQKAVKDGVNDPDSVKFYEYKILDDMACYIINARNQMGGYAGKHSAILMKNDGQWYLLKLIKINLNDCIEIVHRFKDG